MWVLVNLALVENFLKCALNILKKIGVTGARVASMEIILP